MNRLSLIAFVLTIAFAASAVPVHAQPTPSASATPDTAKKAEQLFQEGSALAEKQKWAEAEEKFLAAWSLHPAVDLAVSLGQTQARLHKHREAAEHLEYAIRNWSTVTRLEVRDRAVLRLAEMKKEVGTLLVKVNVQGATVRLNGKHVGTTPIAAELFVEAGEVTLEAQLVGHKSAAQKLNAEKGQRYEVTLTLEPELLPITTATGSADASASGIATAAPSVSIGATGPRKEIVIAGAAVVGVGLIVGLVAGVSAVGTAGDAQTQLDALRISQGPCRAPADTSACKQVEAKLNEQDALTNVAFWSLTGAGLVGIGTGIYVLATRASAKSPGVIIAPSVSAFGGHLIVAGRF